MKQISKFECGPMAARAKVILMVYNSEDQKSVDRLAKFRGSSCPCGKKAGTPAGLSHFQKWISTKGKDPIYVVINTHRKNSLDAVFNTLPHEINHVTAFIAEKMIIGAGEEPISYLSGYMNSQFQQALLKELGYEVVKKEEKEE